MPIFCLKSHEQVKSTPKPTKQFPLDMNPATPKGESTPNSNSFLIFRNLSMNRAFSESISQMNSSPIFDANQKSPNKYKNIDEDQYIEAQNKFILIDYMSNFLDALVDEVCIIDQLQKPNEKPIEIGVKRLIPPYMNAEENNFFVLDQNLGIFNEKERINGRFGW